MEIKIIVKDECGNIFRTTTTNPEIAEMQLDKFITMADNCEDYEEDCDECNECHRCDNWEKYPDEFEDDMEELDLRRAEELLAKRSALKMLKEKYDL